MEYFCDRREEVRELSTALQGKVIRRFMEGIEDAFDKYTASYVGYSSIADYMRAGMQLKPNMQSQEYVYGPMDTILNSFRFVINMFKLMDQSLGPLEKLTASEALPMIVSVMTPCIRKGLISFDAQDYDCAAEVSGILVFVANKFKRAFDLAKEVMAFFIAPSQKSTHGHLLEMSHHIKALASLYKSAK